MPTTTGILLTTFAGPEGWEDDDELSSAQRYTYRDAEMFGAMFVTEWRKRKIDSVLEAGPPYGKLNIWAEPAEAMATWATRVSQLPKDTSPLVIYSLAPERALTFIGW